MFGLIFVFFKCCEVSMLDVVNNWFDYCSKVCEFDVVFEYGKVVF